MIGDMTSSQGIRTRTLSAVATGGPTLLLKVNGVRMLIDPTFSPPGEYETAPGASSRN